MPLLLLSVAGIVLVLNPGWFVGATLVGWILIGFGLVTALIFTLIFGGILALIIKD